MKSTTVTERAQAWVVDYSAARSKAIAWLGDRYLLARPINARERATPGSGAAELRPTPAELGRQAA